MLSHEQVRRLEEVLRATSSPLAFSSFNEFAETVLSPLIELMRSNGGNLYITDVAEDGRRSLLRGGARSRWPERGRCRILHGRCPCIVASSSSWAPAL